MSHWIKILVTIWVFYSFVSSSLSLISTLMVPCASSIVCEFVLYDNFDHYNFMFSNSIVKVKSFGNSLAINNHPVGVSLFFLN